MPNDLPEIDSRRGKPGAGVHDSAAPDAGRDREDGHRADAAADQLEQAGSGADPRSVSPDALQQDEEARHQGSARRSARARPAQPQPAPEPAVQAEPPSTWPTELWPNRCTTVGHVRTRRRSYPRRARVGRRGVALRLARASRGAPSTLRVRRDRPSRLRDRVAVHAAHRHLRPGHRRRAVDAHARLARALRRRGDDPGGPGHRADPRDRSARHGAARRRAASAPASAPSWAR